MQNDFSCNCFTCPYGVDSYNNRLFFYEKINEEPDYEYIMHNIFCHKVGGKIGLYGYCEDVFDGEASKSKLQGNKKQSTKLSRRSRYSEQLKNLEQAKWHQYPSPVMYVTEKWDKELQKYILLKKGYYKRLYRSKSSKHHKRLSNKQVRKYKGRLQNGCNYKKIYDYWWAMY